VKVLSILPHTVVIFVSPQALPHVVGIRIVVVIPDDLSVDRVSHLLVQLDSHLVLDSDKEINEPGLMLVALLLEGVGELRCVTEAASARRDGEGCDMAMPG
jgi:hypothetical protein